MAWSIDAEIYRSELSSTQKLVALALSSFINRHGDAKAWPSVKTLAKMTSLSVRAVQTAIRHLEDVGIVSRQATSTQFGSGTNVYRFALGGFETIWGELDARPPAPAAPPPASDAPKLSNKPSNKQKEIYRSSDKSDAGKEYDSAGFNRFWTAYPRKVGKPAAEKAWRKAIRSAPVETIMAGLSRYIAERQRDSRSKDEMLKFTAHPATWLNQERWNDATGVVDDASF